MTYTELQQKVYQTAKSHGFEGQQPLQALASHEDLEAYGWLNVQAETNPHAAALVRFLDKVNAEMKALTIDRKLLLIVGEVVEAQEALRKGHRTGETYFTPGLVANKPEGFPIELADAAIRIMDLSEDLNIPLETYIINKDAFNVTRPFKHGKQF